MIDISAIATFHREGLLAKPCLDSLNCAANRARDGGATTEIIAVLDRADGLTRSVIEENRNANMKVLEIDQGDPGASRNAGVAAATGEFIAFLDGDDMWGDNWLAAALDQARRDPRLIVWHPEICIYFEDAYHIFSHIDMESDSFETSSLALANYWTSLCFTRRDLLLRIPYTRTDFARQVGYEDWGWNISAIDAGAIHKIVAGTGHAIRVKKTGSQLTASTLGQLVPPPTHYFRRLLADRTARS